MATPDHNARAHPSFTQDDHLTFIPDTSHQANLTARTHIDAPSTSVTRLGGEHPRLSTARRDSVHRDMGDRQRRTDHHETGPARVSRTQQVRHTEAPA